MSSVDTKKEEAILAATMRIRKEEAACIAVLPNGTTYEESGRGVAPILRLYARDVLAGATVVDKVVGKAAAMVMSRAGVVACHALTLSQPALLWLQEKGIQTSYERCVPYIQNRRGDGLCPMEQLVQTLYTDEDIVALLRAKLADLQVPGTPPITAE